MKTTERKKLEENQLSQGQVSIFYLTQKASRDSTTIIFYHLLSYDYHSES